MVSWIGKNNGQRISRIRLCLSATLNRCESYFLVFKLNQTPQSLMFINQKITCIAQLLPHKSRMPIETYTRSDEYPTDATQAGQESGYRDSTLSLL